MKNIIFLICMFIFIIPPNADTKTIQVGSSRAIKTPSQAKDVVSSGDILEIDAGIYEKDAVNWGSISAFTIRGVGKERAHIKAGGVSAAGKGIWVFEGGKDIVIENIEFSGASVPDGNGAGIRFQSTNLTVRNCYFHNNENGILGGGFYENLEDSQVLIENSEFAYCGNGDGQTHNIYIDKIGKFTIRSSYSHDAIVGHNIKSRAMETHILYNRIGGSNAGRESRAMDIPNGGLAFIIGNVIQQAPSTENSNLLGYALESSLHSQMEIFIINNTFVSDRSNGILIDLSPEARAEIINNIFAGSILSHFPGSGSIHASHNIIVQLDEFIDFSTFNYHLETHSQAIDAGTLPPTYKGKSLKPTHQYVHPLLNKLRATKNNIDAGAYEYIATNGPPSQVQGLQVILSDQ